MSAGRDSVRPAAGGRSLFWKFAGVFLLVLVVAAALQAVVSLAVLRPMAANATRVKAQAAVTGAARDLGALTSEPDEPTVRGILATHGVRDGSVLLVAITPAGRIVPERMVPPPMIPQIAHAIAAAGIATPRLDLAPRGPGPGPPGEPPGEPPGAEGPLPEGAGPPPDARGGAGAPPFAPRDRVLVALAHADVPGVKDAVIVGVGAADTASPLATPEARLWLLFLPFAVVAAGVAGLVMMRLLVRRLNALDAVAARVAEGDLSARVPRTGGDEIGALEARFNHMAERLGAARDELHQADAERRRLFENITHELATPLTSIRGYVETMLDAGVASTEAERHGYLRDVLGEAERLDLLVRDLMELTRLESGAQALAPERLDWTALCRNTVRRFEARFAEAGLTLAWDGPADEAWVEADGRRMEQVIENLLANALRYVPRGGAVRVSLARGDAGARHVLRVSDNGPGIAPADLPRVFERFFRVPARRAEEGSGLGLAIVREIVELHGGAVRAERCAPRGVAFVVEMPAA